MFVAQSVHDGIFNDRLDRDLRHQTLRDLITDVKLELNIILRPHIHHIHKVLKVYDLMRDARQLVLHIQAVAENVRKRLTEVTDSRTVRDSRNAAHGVQRVIQKMWVDLRLQRLILSLVQ